MVVGLVTGWTGNSWTKARMAASQFFSPQPTLPQFHGPEVAQADPPGALPPTHTPGEERPWRAPGLPGSWEGGGGAGPGGRGGRGGVGRRRWDEGRGPGSPHPHTPPPPPHLAERRVRALLSRIDVGGGSGQALRSRGVTLHIQRGC